MRIALFSYELSGHQFSGGIGTYARNAAMMLADHGHDVEVFTSGPVSRQERININLVIHHIPGEREMFAAAAAPVFAGAHLAKAFDVMEGPEYGTDAALAAQQFPDVPLLVKLHAPSFTIAEANLHYIPWSARARYMLGGVIRGKIHQYPFKYRAGGDAERLHAAEADLVVGNSKATAAYVGKRWRLDPSRLSFVPFSYEPSTAIQAIVGEPPVTTVLFLGRIEVRKGVLELAKAIPMVLKHAPDVRFVFVGRDLPHPQDRRLLSTHIRELTRGNSDAVEFPGAVDYEGVATHIAAATICVFPSVWEAAGFVCMEAMAGSRAVIGSSSGGMGEFIEPGVTGLLVPPFDSKAIAAAILTLINDPTRRRAMGEAARNSIGTRYAAREIAPLQIASYETAIANARLRSPNTRWPNTWRRQNTYATSAN